MNSKFITSCHAFKGSILTLISYICSIWNPFFFMYIGRSTPSLRTLFLEKDVFFIFLKLDELLKFYFNECKVLSSLLVFFYYSIQLWRLWELSFFLFLSSTSWWLFIIISWIINELINSSKMSYIVRFFTS